MINLHLPNIKEDFSVLSSSEVLALKGSSSILQTKAADDLKQLKTGLLKSIQTCFWPVQNTDSHYNSFEVFCFQLREEVPGTKADLHFHMIHHKQTGMKGLFQKLSQC